jgi:hypothetical protein
MAWCAAVRSSAARTIVRSVAGRLGIFFHRVRRSSGAGNRPLVVNFGRRDTHPGTDMRAFGNIIVPRWRHQLTHSTSPLGLVMLEQLRSDAIWDCHRRRAQARPIAEATSDPHTRSHFLEFERRWAVPRTRLRGRRQTWGVEQVAA